MAQALSFANDGTRLVFAEDDIDAHSPSHDGQRSGRHGKCRADSIIPTAGKEGTILAPNTYKGQSIAVFTSGGDAPGLFFHLSNTKFIYLFIY